MAAGGRRRRRWAGACRPHPHANGRSASSRPSQAPGGRGLASSGRAGGARGTVNEHRGLGPARRVARRQQARARQRRCSDRQAGGGRRGRRADRLHTPAAAARVTLRAKARGGQHASWSSTGERVAWSDSRQWALAGRGPARRGVPLRAVSLAPPLNRRSCNAPPWRGRKSGVISNTPNSPRVSARMFTVAATRRGAACARARRGAPVRPARAALATRLSPQPLAEPVHDRHSRQYLLLPRAPVVRVALQGGAGRGGGEGVQAARG